MNFNEMDKKNLSFSNTLFVNDFPPDAQEEDLLEFFNNYKVIQCRIVR